MRGFVLFLLSFFSVVASAREPATITFKNLVYVETDSVTLAALVDPSSREGIANGDLAFLEKTVLSSAPEPGSVISFSDHAISEILRSEMRKVHGPQAAEVLKSWNFKIPSEINVRKAFMEFNENNFRSQLTTIMQKDCSECQYEYSKIRLPPKRPSSDGMKWEISLSQRLKGPFQLKVDFKEGDRILFSDWVSGEVHVFRDVAVAQRALRIGERLEDKDIKISRRDITFALDSAPLVSEIVGAKVRRGLALFEVIQRSDIEKEKAVNRGESVEAILQNSMIRVALKGVAQDSGAVGDLVRVLNPNSKKIVSGTVLEKGVVEIR